MIQILMMVGLSVGFNLAGATTPGCEDDLSSVNSAAADPYARLGLEPGVASTHVSARFARAVRAASSPAEVHRLAEAYAQIRLDLASGRRLDKSDLPVRALRRAHGKIFGDPLSGRFTAGYGLSEFMQPTADAELLVREVLREPSSLTQLAQLPRASRGDFETVLTYFMENIRRVGVEGGFEDTVTVDWPRGLSSLRKRDMAAAVKSFVQIFGTLYQEALTDRKSEEFLRIKRRLGSIRLPKVSAVRPNLIDQLRAEKDPRTFLRKILFQLRRPKRGDDPDFLLRMSEIYTQKFLVDSAQFLQHLLYFGSAEWPGLNLNLEILGDQRVVDEVMRSLEYVWIKIPEVKGLEPRWFDYISVLWDVYDFFGGTSLDQPQPTSSLWRQLTGQSRLHPEVFEAVHAERQAPALASDLLPW